jgi:hypothetical protein
MIEVNVNGGDQRAEDKHESKNMSECECARRLIQIVAQVVDQIFMWTIRANRAFLLTEL